MTSEPDPLETAATICARHGNDPALLIEILHDVQEAVGFVPEPCLPEIAQRLNIARAEVHGVMTFYHDFRRQPVEGVVVKLCQAEACQAMGARALADALRGHSTMTVEPVYCLGNCALSPAAMVNGRLLGRVTAEYLEEMAVEAVS